MNEAADFGGNLTAVVLFWLWWVLLTVINVAAEISRKEGAGSAVPATGEPAGDDADPSLPDAACRERIRDLDPSFDERHFMRGAALAYEIVLQAYAAGDLATLRRLLSGEVLAAFEVAIAERLRSGLVLDLTFIGLSRASIRDVWKSGDGMAIVVHFAAEIVSATRAADGELVAGDPVSVVETSDLWVFEPDPVASGRAWLITATDTA